MSAHAAGLWPAPCAARGRRASATSSRRARRPPSLGACSGGVGLVAYGGAAATHCLAPPPAATLGRAERLDRHLQRLRRPLPALRLAGAVRRPRRPRPPGGRRRFGHVGVQQRLDEVVGSVVCPLGGVARPVGQCGDAGLGVGGERAVAQRAAAQRAAACQGSAVGRLGRCGTWTRPCPGTIPSAGQLRFDHERVHFGRILHKKMEARLTPLPCFGHGRHDRDRLVRRRRLGDVVDRRLRRLRLRSLRRLVRPDSICDAVVGRTWRASAPKPPLPRTQFVPASDAAAVLTMSMATSLRVEQGLVRKYWPDRTVGCLAATVSSACVDRPLGTVAGPASCCRCTWRT